MSRLRSHVDRLRDTLAGTPTVYAVWRQDPNGADVFTSPAAPGVVLTSAELAARREQRGVHRIVVYRTSARGG